MYWTKKDIEPAIEVFKKIFGKQFNNNIHNANELVSVSIMTREFGKLWSGDFVLNEDTKNKLEILSVTINQRVYLVKDYNWIDPIYVTTSKLQELVQENY